MPSSSILSATSRLFVTNLSPKQHLFDSPRQYNRSQFQCSKGFLRFSVSCEGGRSGSSSSRLLGLCSSKEAANGLDLNSAEGDEQLRIEVGNPNSPAVFTAPKFTLGDQAFFLLAFIACTTSIAFTSLVIAAIPTLYAMGRAATSLSKLADTAREELPSTMAAIRLSGMEISDLTLELSDLSQEIADGVSKSTQAVQAAEAGIRKIGVLAREQTISMIQERASLPIISLQPVVAGAARKTSRAMGQAKKTLMHMISRGDLRPENEENEDHRAKL